MTHTQTHDEAAFDEVGSPTPVPKVSRWFLSVMIFLLAAGITGVFLLGWLPKVQQHGAVSCRELLKLANQKISFRATF